MIYIARTIYFLKVVDLLVSAPIACVSLISGLKASEI